MDNYQDWKNAVLKSDPDLPGSYIRALYDRSIDPHNPSLADIWYKEWVAKENLKKRQIKHADTIFDLIECGFLNMKDAIQNLSKRRNAKHHFE